MAPFPFDDLGDSSLLKGYRHEIMFKDLGHDVLIPPTKRLARFDFWAHPPLKEDHLRHVNTGFALKYMTTDGEEIELDDSGEDACVEDCKSQLNPEKLSAEAKNPIEKYNNVLNPDGEMNMCITYCRDEFEVLCFPGDASVQVKGKGSIALDHLVVGDEVLVAKQSAKGTWELQFDQVINFLHRDLEALYTCLRIQHEFGALSLTQGHLVFVHRPRSFDVAVPARDVCVGDVVLVLWVDGSVIASTVTSVSTVAKKGAYAPLTNSGTILVNGTAASCYALPPSVLEAIPFRALAAVTGNIQNAAHSTMLPLRLFCRHSHVGKQTVLHDAGICSLRPQLRGGSPLATGLMSKTEDSTDKKECNSLSKSSVGPKGVHPYAWGLYLALTLESLPG